MSNPEKACAGAWAANLALICATNAHEVGHCLAVLLLYGAVYFLFAPLHAAIAAGVWVLSAVERPEAGEPRGPVWRALDRLLCAESLVFWGVYWAMVFEAVPLYFRTTH